MHQNLKIIICRICHYVFRSTVIKIENIKIADCESILSDEYVNCQAIEKTSEEMIKNER